MDLSLSFLVLNERYKAELVHDYEMVVGNGDKSVVVKNIEKMIEELGETVRDDYSGFDQYKFELYVDKLFDQSRTEPLVNHSDFIKKNTLYRISQMKSLIYEIESETMITKAYFNFYLMYLMFKIGSEYFKDSWFFVDDVRFSVDFLTSISKIDPSFYSQFNLKYWEIAPLKRSPYGSHSRISEKGYLEHLLKMLTANEKLTVDYGEEARVFREMIISGIEDKNELICIKGVS